MTTSLPDSSPPTEPAGFVPKKPPKLLSLLGGLALILISLALGIMFFGQDKTTSPAGQSSSSANPEDSVAWPKYASAEFFYELAIPPKWIEIFHSPLHPEFALFNVPDTATFEITAQKNSLGLDEYLAAQDETTKDTIKSTQTSQVKVGQYDGYERSESWPKLGLQGIVTYIKVSDMLYTFTLAPALGKNAVTNESIIRLYRAALASFRLTDTSQLGLDLQEYVSPAIAPLAFKAFSLKYPQTWVLKDEVGDNTLAVSIYRNNYELTISQKAVGGAVCLFSDSPAFEGSSGDLRNKQFAEFNTTDGTILRRYFNLNMGDKSSMFFCQKQTDGPYFETPLAIGGLVYNVPAKYDPDIIKEMDGIVKSLTIIEPPATPQP